MWRDRLTRAAWCSIAYSVLAMPALILGLIAGKATWGTPVWFGDLVLTAIYMSLWAYSAFVFVELLTRVSAPTDVIGCVTLYIWINISSAIVLTLAPLPDVAAGALALCSVVALGVVGLIFAVQLLRSKQRLFGLAEPFAYTHLAGDICLLSCILAPLALLIAIANNVILAIMFFRAADIGEEPQSMDGAPPNDGVQLTGGDDL